MAGGEPAQSASLPKCRGSVDGCHRQDFFRTDIRKRALKLPHLGEHAEIVVARQAIGSEAHINSKGAQFCERKWRMTEVAMTPRAMGDREAAAGGREQIKIAFAQLVH